MRWVLVALLAGCVSGRDGTAVGNPTMDAQLARVDGAVVETAMVETDRVVFSACDGTVTTANPGILDLVARDPVPMPASPLCGIDVVTARKLRIEGTTAAGREMRVEIDTAGIRITPVSSGIGPQHYVLEIGVPGWLNVADEDGDVEIDPNDDAHAGLLRAIETASGLFVDGDDDGAVSDGERAAGAVAGSQAFASGDTDDEPDSGEDTEETGDDTESDTDEDTDVDTDV